MPREAYILCELSNCTISDLNVGSKVSFATWHSSILALAVGVRACIDDVMKW